MKTTTIFVTLVAVVVSGCGSPNTELSKQEQSDFKGAPMPADARTKMNESIAKWKEKQGQQNSASPAPGRGA